MSEVGCWNEQAGMLWTDRDGGSVTARAGTAGSTRGIDRAAKPDSTRLSSIPAPGLRQAVQRGQ